MSEGSPQGQPDEAMLDLLIKQVTEGLSPAEQRELDVLDSEVASAYARDLERAAAAIAVAGTSGSEPMPAALRARIEAEARAFLASNAADAAARASEAPAQPTRLTRPERSRAGGTGSASGWSAAGWWAAAACLALAAVGWLRSPSIRSAPPPANVQMNVPPPAPAPPVVAQAPTPAEQRAAMLAKPDAVKVSLDATKDPAAAGASGDVVWDPATQQGFLHFAGLKPNDPRRHQYQLWIFDGERDQRYPVDGGVFDVPADAGEVVVPIRAALLVHTPKAFAVTVEKPGGVVVSGREHVVALGKAS
jgi:Anti-sigma-K factor rskA